MIWSLFGTPEILERRASSGDMTARIQLLIQRTEDNPESFEDWWTLATSYATIGDDASAVEAYRHAAALEPGEPGVQAAYADGAIKEFERHSRLGFVSLEAFMQEVERLRNMGFKRISLKTGSYGMEALALAIRVAADAKLDLLTIDGSGGGTGMSPWNMMQSWGVPSITLHAKAYEYANILAGKGLKVVDMSFAGGFALEDSIFKAIALGAPYTKLVCMGRAIMIPGFLGSNIEGALFEEKRAEVNGHWNELPKTVRAVGRDAKEIFAGMVEEGIDPRAAVAERDVE